MDSDDFDAVLAKVSNASSADREVREKLHILANIEARKATDQWWKLGAAVASSLRKARIPCTEYRVHIGEHWWRGAQFAEKPLRYWTLDVRGDWWTNDSSFGASASARWHLREDGSWLSYVHLMNTESYATVKEIWVKGPVPEPARGSSLRAEDYLFPPGGRIAEPRIGREEYAPSLKTFANADGTRLAFDVAVPTSLSPTYVQNGVLCMPGAGTLGMALVEAVKRLAESHSR